MRVKGSRGDVAGRTIVMCVGLEDARERSSIGIQVQPTHV